MQAAPRSAARWRLRFAVALLTLAFVLAACGGGDDGDDGDAGATSAQEDVDAGDGIAPGSDTDETGVNDPGDSATSTNAADGAGTITVSAGGETFTTSGTCIIIDEGVIDQFASPVGTFVIINDDPPMANGYFFQPPGVSAQEWDIPNTAEGTVLQQTATSQHYEGPGLLDDVDVEFIVDVECP
ncbi:MAG: hypothetical protein KJN71_00300 [Acidimicrobiia bacterium]|nr:hypothetical protein [Acidimicrobiia bacterium]